MKFLNKLSVNFLGPKKWELSAPLSFEFECDEKFKAILDEYQFDRMGNISSLSVNTHSFIVTLTVQSQFVTDLASIPRPCWALIAPWDVARAAVVHDLLYKRLRKLKKDLLLSNSDVNKMRSIADNIFLMGMKSAEPDIPLWKIHACHKAVRAFGRFVI